MLVHLERALSRNMNNRIIINSMTQQPKRNRIYQPDHLSEDRDERLSTQYKVANAGFHDQNYCLHIYNHVKFSQCFISNDSIHE